MRGTGVSLLVAALLVFSGVALQTTEEPRAVAMDEDSETLAAIEDLHVDPPVDPGIGPQPSRYDAVKDVVQSETVTVPNPWGKATVTVGVISEAGDTTRIQRAAVQQTVAYWNDHSSAHSPFEVAFEYTPDASRPDIAVHFVEYIDNCGRQSHESITLGCAPRFDNGETTSIPTTVWIRDDRPMDALRFSVKHEFGHLLGLHHGEGPMPLMAERAPFEPGRAVPDAIDRENPWHESTLAVAVTQDGSYSQRVLEAHVREALAYYEAASADSGARSLSFRLVDDPARADIVLRVTRKDQCGVGGGYCWSVTGEQLDRDAPLEYYTKFEATLGDLRPRYLSWYTGRVIGYALGAQDESSLPTPFTDPTEAADRWFDPEPSRTDRDSSTVRSKLDSR